MRGHEQLIALRRQGLVPKSVQVWCGADALKGWSDWHTSSPHAEIEIADDDALSGLDLRCCVGLLVCVNGTDPFRVAAVHAACVRGGAARVVSAAVTFAHPGAEGVAGRLMDSTAEAACTS